jgi:hypothetical protein
MCHEPSLLCLPLSSTCGPSLVPSIDVYKWTALAVSISLDFRLCWLVDAFQVEEINCSAFRYRKVCQTHEELKVLVSKFNRKNNNEDVFGFLGISVQGNKY